MCLFDWLWLKYNWLWMEDEWLSYLGKDLTVILTNLPRWRVDKYILDDLTIQGDDRCIDSFAYERSWRLCLCEELTDLTRLPYVKIWWIANCRRIWGWQMTTTLGKDLMDFSQPHINRFIWDPNFKIWSTTI